MNDPHVVTLLYYVNVGVGADYDRAPPLEFEIASFRLRLAQADLVCTPKVHFASPDEARRVLDEFLRAWEVDIALRYGSQELSFQFKRAEMIDRRPPAPGSVTLELAGATAGISIGVLAEGHVSRSAYPSPPLTFRLTPDAETLYGRYRGYKEGREPLQSMAYACLTLVEGKADSRSGAAKLYNIDLKILKLIGEISSTLGDDSTARKLGKDSTGRPLSDSEIAWADAAIKALIWQVGRFGFTGAQDRLKMADLPNL